ncbi:toxin VasX [Halomonas caseinilytica]|uniref:toxin VasX n=1 Tax=Halomonas caseinilytica TaxID=438744 RepID=UPI0008484556|nr:toxin VasX [Halomonas caseinilytica]
MSAAQCPLLAALIPVRYAVGHEALTSHFLDGLSLPSLQGACLSDAATSETRPLRYVARPLRDGWCYVWLEQQQRMIEYQVEGGNLTETDRGGPVVMPGGGPYLFLPVGQTALLAWSPVRWSEAYHADLAARANRRQALMRAIMPGQGPASGPLEWATEVPELAGTPETAFAWSSEPDLDLPRWETLMPTLTQAEIQAVAVIDDPWGVVIDLAYLVRRGYAQREAWFAKEGEERTLARYILALARQNREFWAELPHLADQPRIEEAAKRYDTEIAELEARLSGIVTDWRTWMETLWAQGEVASLAAAQAHFDPAEPEHHDAMETLWTAGLLGPTQSQAGAELVERLMDPQRGPQSEETGHSLWAVLLSQPRSLTLSDVARLLTAGDLAAENDWQGWSANLNQLAAGLGQGTAALREGLFIAIGPVVGPLLKQQGAGSAHQTLVAGYFAAALARSGQRLVAEPVAAKQVIDWLNEPAARAAGAPASLASLRPDLLPELEGQRITTLRLAANEATAPPRGNPFVETLEDAKLKGLLLVINGWMLKDAVADALEEGLSVETSLPLGSSFFGTAAVAGAMLQHTYQLRVDTLQVSEGMSGNWAKKFDQLLAVGQATNFVLGLATAFDAIYFGRQALDRWNKGDADSTAVLAGMSAASAGQAALAARAFWLYRRARAALALGQAAEAAALASRAGTPGMMLGLVILVIGGAISLHVTRETPLQDWVRNTRFGRHPADWAGDLQQELDRLFRLLYAPRVRLERRNEWNHRLGTRYQSVWLLVEFPGAAPPFPGMFTWQAEATWRTGWFGGETRKVVITEQDLALDIGGRHGARPVYRRVYHDDAEGATLQGLSGTLYYRPRPGLTLSPIELSID